jgi:hypothetical protein
MGEATTDLACARCGEALDPDVPVWVELTTGVLRITPLRDFDDAFPPARAWHPGCLEG